MKKLLALAVLACGSLFAQAEYTITSDRNLSAAADALTIQQPATGAKMVSLTGLSVYCSVACDVTIERNGTAATATAGTPVALTDVMGTAQAKVFTSSDAGTGTVISKTPIPAGAPTIFDVKKLRLSQGGTSHNYTVRVSSITGRSVIVLQWQESALSY